VPSFCTLHLTVLQDVVRAMFTPDFISELFKPQELYSSASARQIFDKVLLLFIRTFSSCVGWFSVHF